MSVLTLVRHGQARTFEPGLDHLTDLGAQQARELRRWWDARGMRFDEVRCGSLLRQQETAALLADMAPTVDPAWNEYDAAGLLSCFAPGPRPSDARRLQRAIESVLLQWAEGGATPPGVETWPQFRGRILGALEQALAGEGSGRRVLVVTSGGPIGVCVQHALQAPPLTALQLNWRIRNCSVTEFLFQPGRFTLDSFNTFTFL